MALVSRWVKAARLLALCSVAGFAADPATVTGRVFDVYHRAVPSARVAPIERRDGRLFAAAPEALVDGAGMYRLTLPAGRYILAVLPPAHDLDFATVFPAYFQDTLDPAAAQPVTLAAGELRPFVDFLLLDTEPHQVSGKVTGLPSGPATISLYASTGYAGPLRTVTADREGRFQFDRVPAGSYELVAKVSALSGSIHVEVSAPEVRDLQIPLRATR